jgi:2-keto-3-deoxy-L-fuconate dehydrogenase
MARRLEGKTVFVTAAAQGMGRAAVLAMAREGARIIATDIREDLLQTLRAEVLAEGGIAPDVRRLDVTEPGAIESMMGSVGALDVLFNCAGYVHQGTILQASDDDWDLSFAINVRSMVRTIRSALPAMIAQGGGSIINMASVCSSIKGLPNRAVYGTTKAAVLGLTKAIAADFVGQRVRCNAICPGTVETPSNLAMWTKRGACSPRASPWVGSPTPTKSFRLSFISQATKARLPPGNGST